MRLLYRLLRIIGDARAASRGPDDYGMRLVRRQAHRALARMLRRT